MKYPTIELQTRSVMTSLLHNNPLIDSRLNSRPRGDIIVILYIIYRIVYHLPAIEVKGGVMKRHFISAPFVLNFMETDEGK